MLYLVASSQALQLQPSTFNNNRASTGTFVPASPASTAYRSRPTISHISSFARPSTTSASRSALFASQFDGEATHGRDNNEELINRLRKYKPTHLMKQAFIALVAFQATLRNRFTALSRKAQLIIVANLMALGLVCGTVAHNAMAPPPAPVETVKAVEVPYSTFMDLAEESSRGTRSIFSKPKIAIDGVVIGSEKVEFQVKQNKEVHQVYARKPQAPPDMIDFLRKNKIEFSAPSVSSSPSNAAATLAQSAMGVFYMLFMLRMYRSMSGKGGGDMMPGKLAPSSNDDDCSVTFDDIAGVDKAKFEVQEFVDTLRNPQKYAMLGARAPTGLLLEGPPGTGKTLLARATAASAGVPLLYCSGSDFVEMYAGKGAARVRKLFDRAAKMAPCIVFIDEIDAVGKSRSMGAGSLQSNDEAEQTLIQLLASMDGLDSSKGVCVMGATNRKEMLDSALVRPGRFDRIIKVDLPDAAGRENILRVHANKLPGFSEGRGTDDRPGSLGKGNIVDLSALAAATDGLGGAELEFIVNEAAIRAVRRIDSQATCDGRLIAPYVSAEDFEDSVQSFFSTRKPRAAEAGFGKTVMNVKNELISALVG